MRYFWILFLIFNFLFINQDTYAQFSFIEKYNKKKFERISKRLTIKSIRRDDFKSYIYARHFLKGADFIPIPIFYLNEDCKKFTFDDDIFACLELNPEYPYLAIILKQNKYLGGLDCAFYGKQACVFQPIEKKKIEIKKSKFEIQYFEDFAQQLLDLNKDFFFVYRFLHCFWFIENNDVFIFYAVDEKIYPYKEFIKKYDEDMIRNMVDDVF